MARNAVPVGAPPWMITFADLMSLLVCFFVIIISYSVPDTEQHKVVAGSMRDAFGFQREMIVTGMVEIDGNPRFEYPRDLQPLPIEATVGPIPDDNDDITELRRREEAWRQLLDELEAERPQRAASETRAVSREERRFEQIERDLRQAMQSVPELERMAENLMVERTPEGLRIQIVDQEKSSMFPLGSARMYERTKTLLRHVAKVISSLPNKVSIAGHTDGLAYRSEDGYDNWSLSLDRADATRRMLVESGLGRQRIATVIGKADTEHVFPDHPLDPRNRRISITLLREQPSLAPSGARGRDRDRGTPHAAGT
jgi:chemotaxis protein MotB